MDRKHNRNNLNFARNMRKNMTKEERHLWYDFLRDYPVKFTRQKILGRYIADFYCASCSLVVELDGSQHYDDDAIAKDNERTQYLEQFNIEVIRIANNQVNQNFRGVCEYIDHIVKSKMSLR